MKILGLTGSIGMGKSTAAQMFRQLGVPVFDADACVHGLQAPGGKALAAIEKLFPGTTSAAGLERAKLGALVFGNPDNLRQLESVMHPLVNAARQAWLAQQVRMRKPLVVLDIPLLFEKGGWRMCDFIAVVSAPKHVQAARVLARPGMTPEKFAAILRSQKSDAEKRRRADVILPTGLGKRLTRDAVRGVITLLTLS
jgi:dephospho-CoA kinase